jgi:GNAT superfamily N-acetyltransferase
VNESALTPVVAVVRSDGDLADMIEVRVQADPDAPPPQLDNLRNNLAGNPSLAYLVARVGGSPVGCAFVDVSPETVARAHLVVVPAARWRGVGSALLDAVSEHARAASKTQLEGQIRASDDESLAFFARRGFKKVGGEDAVALDLSEAEGVVAEAPPASASSRARSGQTSSRACTRSRARPSRTFPAATPSTRSRSGARPRSTAPAFDPS